MDSALNLLKQEINKTNEQEHDFAKWKLGVTAALGVAAFGLAKDSNPNYWLLLLVPFVCAYIDLYAYQYQFRILVIARFIREYPEGDAILNKYEQEVEKLRKHGVFSLGTSAGIGCSLGATVLGPAFYFLDRRHHADSDTLLVCPAAAGVIWLLGALLVVFLWWRFRNQVGNLSG
jgi:hypothetical protein